MGKTLSFLLALSLLVVFAQCKQGWGKQGYGGHEDGDYDTDGSGSGDSDWDDDEDGDDGEDGDDDDWGDDGSGLELDGKKSYNLDKHGVRVTHWKNKGHKQFHVNFCFVQNCLRCKDFNCQRCMPGYRLTRRQAYALGRSCVPDCPLGMRHTNGRCQKNVCRALHCKKCQKFPWTRSCTRCEDGWYRHKAPRQLIANCVKVCPRGYREANGTRNFGSTCEVIPFFCYNAPHCIKCQKFPWTRSCITCEDGWHRYKAPFQQVANCVRVCPRGYRATVATRNYGPTCEKIPFFCYNAPHCIKCQKFPWTRSCVICEDGWHRYKAPYQKIANCVRVCPRGYRATVATRNFGSTCEKIPFFCYNAPHCIKCQKFPWTRSCVICEDGWHRYKAPYQQVANCVRVCPRGYRATVATRNFGSTCEKIPSFCYNAPHCIKCQKFPWARSCITCEDGWYRHKAPFQLIANCVNVCPRGYRATVATRNYGPTCKKIPSFCYNAPHCVKCQNFPWTRSCIRCEEGWYRYKAPNQIIARCIRECPRGYQATVGTRSFGPTCNRIPSFCHQVQHCEECQGPQWSRSCIMCDDGWYRYKSPHQLKTRCIRVCPRGYRATNGTHNFGPTCKKIPSFCHQLRHCNKCPGFPWPRACKRCERGWYRYKPPYHKTTRCIKACPRGYQATKGTRKFGPTCKKIKSFCLRLRHCKVCREQFPMPRSCERCDDGWYRYTAPYQVTTRCIKACPRGYQATNDTRDIGPSCEKIQSFCYDLAHCKECPGPIWPPSCKRCEEGWYRYKDPPTQISTTCIQECPIGFQATNDTDLVGPTCEKLRAKCHSMPGCKVCPKINVCLKCQANMSIFEGLFESKCVYKCPKGFDETIKNGTSICLPQEGCLDKFCIMCKKGWYKLNHQGRVCHRLCPSGYYKYLSNCMKCTSGCKECNTVFKCDLCADGMAKLKSRLGFGERCVLNCPRGYTKELVNGTSYECRKVCLDKNCDNCESVSFHGPQHCDYCKPTFHKLHRALRDKCVTKCPAGYVPEMDDIEGSVCRKDADVSPSWKPLPTTSDFKPTPFVNISMEP